MIPTNTLKQRIRENLAGMLIGLILTYYFGSSAMSQFEDAAVLRDGQFVDARVMSLHSARGYSVATIEYSGTTDGRKVACIGKVSLGTARTYPGIGEQISVGVRPGPCTRPVSRTTYQWPWVFVGVTLLMLAVTLACAVHLARCIIPSRQRQ
ncbi:hypothetical protein OFEAOIEE_LOCUS3180 [Methylorubrum extorquens]